MIQYKKWRDLFTQIYLQSPSNQRLEYKINSTLPILNTPKENNRLKELTKVRQEVYII